MAFVSFRIPTAMQRQFWLHTGSRAHTKTTFSASLLLNPTNYDIIYRSTNSVVAIYQAHFLTKSRVRECVRLRGGSVMAESACPVFCTQQIFLHFNRRCGQFKTIKVSRGITLDKCFWCLCHRKCMQAFKRHGERGHAQKCIKHHLLHPHVFQFRNNVCVALTSSTLTRMRSICPRASDCLHSLRILPLFSGMKIY